MKISYRTSLVLLALAAALPAGAKAAGDPAAGKIKAFTCMGCHGIVGYNNVYPTYKVPKLGGQHVQYLVAALQAYKNGQRSHGTMQAQAQTLSEQDMQDIAAFFAQNGGNGD
ncbi:MAG: cytochrome c [Gammaproteobacteria bacterium]|jgi:cytochrome c553